MEYQIVDDVLYRYTFIEKTESGHEVVKREEVIEKDAFIECYKEWIEGKDEKR